MVRYFYSCVRYLQLPFDISVGSHFLNMDRYVQLSVYNLLREHLKICIYILACIIIYIYILWIWDAADSLSLYSWGTVNSNNSKLCHYWALSQKREHFGIFPLGRPLPLTLIEAIPGLRFASLSWCPFVFGLAVHTSLGICVGAICRFPGLAAQLHILLDQGSWGFGGGQRCGGRGRKW